MCGIFAAVGPPLAQAAVQNVFEALNHRGPDGRGLFVDEATGLTMAHTRLAVIDLVTGEQPLESEDGAILLSANGEIYDFERIRSALEARGYVFKTRCDSEVIIYLYKEYGLGCFEHLRGEFAFLLYDRKKRILIAARDRFGIKPLYFSRLDRGFVFASEMKAIFASGLVEPRLDAAALDPFLEQDPDKVRFPFAGIEHVPPASYAVVHLDTLEVEMSRYWSAELPPEIAEPIPEPADAAADEAAKLVLDQLEDAVRLRLRADVPVGLYLSGGVDSAFVGALMKRNSATQVHSFSIGFTSSGRNEQQLAAEAARFIGTEHHELELSKQQLWDNLEQCLWFSELPFVTLAPVGKFLLSKRAREKVTVVLTGEGADELFLGYRSFFRKAVRDGRSGANASSAPRRRLKMGRFAERVSLRIFHKDQRRRIASARAGSARRFDPSKPLINAVQEARIAAMPLDILAYLGDREEMAHSLEARLPFLDHHLYEAARSIPVDLKLRNGMEKAVLRDAAKGILPEEIRRRRKSGFMLTSDAADFFGADRAATAHLRNRYLSRQKFEGAGVFSYRAYRLAAVVARLGGTKRLRRLRRNANKVVMYMMQTHMLHDMFVANPRWRSAPET